MRSQSAPLRGYAHPRAMTDTTISRLGSSSFTPPEPITLGGSGRARRTRQEESEPEQLVYEEATEPVFDGIDDTDIEPLPFDEVPGAAPARTTTNAAPIPEASFSLRKRIALLIAIVAVPAMASTGDIGAEPGAAPTEAQRFAALSDTKPLPFERAGMSFPGSAFFFVDAASDKDLVALPSSDPLQPGGEFGYDIGSLIDAGPAAAGFFVAGSSISKARAQQCLAEAIWYEAGTESEAGQRAVAQVVLNRVAHPAWPSSICGVVYEGSQRQTGCQFSFTCDGSLSRSTSGASWRRAQDIAEDALSGKVYTPIGLATHYHARWVNPYWAGSLKPIGTIGAHLFYREPGKAGEKSAFTGTYSGIEPSVSGRIPYVPSANPAPSGSSAVPSFTRPSASRPSTPAVAQPVADQAPKPETPAAAATATPTGSALADPKLRSSGQVKDRYSNAGQWKKTPGAAAPAPKPATD